MRATKRAWLVLAFMLAWAARCQVAAGSDAQTAVQFTQVKQAPPSTADSNPMIAQAMAHLNQESALSVYSDALVIALRRVSASLASNGARFAMRAAGFLKQANAGGGFSMTTTMSSQRTRIDVLNSTTLVQCDLRRIVVLNNDAKTYTAESFDDLAPTNFVSSALAQAASSGHNGPAPVEKTETIAGMTAHQEVETMSLGAGGMTKTQETWYGEFSIPDQCNPTAASATNSSSSTQMPHIRVPLRVVGKLNMPGLSNLPSPPPGAPANTPTMPDLAALLTTRYETTSVKEIPYEASYFDVPSGYTQVPLPPPPPEQTPPPNLMP